MNPYRLRFIPVVALAALASACGAPGDPRESSATSTSALVTLTAVTGFGPNPGALNMYKYAPPSLPPGAPLVLALHGCTQTAADYANTGWNALADKYKFYVLYAEQTTANNPARCFNWAGHYGDPTNLQRGKGENESIKEMVDKMKADHSIDPKRVFVTGVSAGAAEAVLLAAVWPDVFAGAAPIAGVPFDCTTTFSEVNACISPGKDLTGADWGNRVRAADPGFAGPWPTVSVWQGTQDTTVSPNNEKEMIRQWTNVHGISETPTATDTVNGFPHAVYARANGTRVVESYAITAMAHGVPVDTAQGCGTTGAYVLDAHICSSMYIARFWGIVPDGGTDGGAGGPGGGGGAGDAGHGGGPGGGGPGGGGPGSGGAGGSGPGGGPAREGGSGAVAGPPGGAAGAPAPQGDGGGLAGCSQGGKPAGDGAWLAFAVGLAALGWKKSARRRGARMKS